MRSLVVASAAVAAAFFVVVVGSAGCTPCHAVTTKRITLDCGSAAFTGEIHLDSAASYRSFLSDRCLLDATDTEIEALVDDVDFTVDAVFVARGTRSGSARCIEDRAAESVDVCDDGLRVIFDDVESDEAGCGGLWTVAFSLPRDELRAALADPGSGSSFE